MKTPGSLETLVDYGIIQEVVRPLMSGKEAQVYVVLAQGGLECVAKVYKEATQRTFKHRAEYTEGRRTRNTRDQRAIQKRTRHGRQQDEAAWRSSEVDTIHRLRAAGVRVPEPYNFMDGVLVMELVKDARGEPAPRLGDLELDASAAHETHRSLIREVVRMLCAGVIHGDLSEFNVLMGADGPVVIDFPQSVDAARNPSARKLLLRDVENLERFLSRFAPGDRIQPFAEEMWALYETNRLEPDTQLTGSYRRPTGPVHTDEVLALIEDAGRDERRRRDPRGRDPQDEDAVAEGPPPLRRVVEFGTKARGRSGSDRSRSRAATRGPRSDRREESGSRPAAEAAAPTAPAADRAAATRPGRRGRRRRPRGSEKPGSGSDTAARAGGPQGPRGPREPQGEAKGAQAKGRPDPGRDSRGAEERAPAEGPARSRRARRSRRKASQSPTEEQAGRAPRPPTRSTTERERSERSDTPRNGSDPSRRGRGRQRRSESRST